jgi:hypothetical protein
MVPTGAKFPQAEAHFAKFVKPDFRGMAAWEIAKLQNFGKVGANSFLSPELNRHFYNCAA